VFSDGLNESGQILTFATPVPIQSLFSDKHWNSCHYRGPEKHQKIAQNRMKERDYFLSIS